MGKLTSIFPVLLCACAVSAGHAQPVAPAAPAPAAPAAAAAEKEPFPAKPLRYVSEKDRDEFLRTTVSTFAIATRDFDPFGLPQDPDYRPPAPQPTLNTSPDAAPVVPFSDIISRIQITTVMSGERKFLVGSRSFSVGDRFPLNVDGQAIWIEVTEVSARQVQFKNIQTGESAAQVLNILPPGMRPGSGGITAPGMVPAGQQAPLDLPPSNNAPDPSR